MMNNKKTVVFGASLNPDRYSNIVIKRLRQHDYEVEGLGLREGKIDDVSIHLFGKKVINVHTVTIYMNANRQAEYKDEILALNPRRIIFNPGAENEDLFIEARKKGIEVENACTLILLSRGVY